MSDERLERLRIASHQKRRSSLPTLMIVGAVVLITGAVAWWAVPRAGDDVRSGMKSGSRNSGSDPAASTAKPPAASPPGRPGPGIGTNAVAGGGGAAGVASSQATGSQAGSLLTVSGYIIARERIEISPRFMGVVQWVGVKKGDAVTNGQVVVRLDDAEYRARLAENDGALAVAEVAIERAHVDLRRSEPLVSERVETLKALDDARLALRTAEAQRLQVLGARKSIETVIDWCIIRSPVTGVVLEKLVDPGELVTPQTFGGTRGPSSSLVAVADLRDLQVEVDIDESKLARVALGQGCLISPVSYPDKRYQGRVAEIAPEANRAKGTVQVKVQILEPDRFLTPELSATVDFLGGGK